MEDVVPMEVRRDRTRQLRILSSKMHRAHYQRHLGTMRPVLFEKGDGILSDTMEGYTDNYIRVTLPYDPALVDRIVSVELQRIDGDGHVLGAVRRHSRSQAGPMDHHHGAPAANLPLAN